MLLRTRTALGVSCLVWSLAATAGPAPAATDRLILHLPSGTAEVPLVLEAGTPGLTADSLAAPLRAAAVKGVGGAVALRWGDRAVRFTPDRQEVETSRGTAVLPARPRRLGATLWLPPEAAAVAARERFGAERVRWDAARGVLAVAGPAAAAEVRALRVGTHPDRVRVVLEASQPVDWAVAAEGEGRLLVSLPGSVLGQGIARRRFAAGILRAVDPAQGADSVHVRLVFAGQLAQARWFALPDPFRVVVDLFRAPPGGAAPPSSDVSKPSTGGDPAAPAGGPALQPSVGKRSPDYPEPSAVPHPAAPPPAGRGEPSPGGPRALPGQPFTVVIDPGHGGKDTGAIGPRGLKEKDVVLDIALRLRRLLAERLGARVILTRSDDTFVPLEERTAIANRARADFFLSIHLNAAPQGRVNGVETYYFSQEPSDGHAKAAAARENLVLNLEGLGEGEQESLKAVLLDMAQTLHLRESSALAEILLEDLGRGLRADTRGVKHGPFVVLMTAGMPSALVEVAFISNAQVERRLTSEAHRQAIAAALSGGIERFAQRYQRRLGMRPARLASS